MGQHTWRPTRSMVGWHLLSVVLLLWDQWFPSGLQGRFQLSALVYAVWGFRRIIEHFRVRRILFCENRRSAFAIHKPLNHKRSPRRVSGQTTILNATNPEFLRSTY